MRDSTGFTLIELLVVVAIIVLLLSLLTPALDSAMYAAEKANCLSNVRTSINAMALYASESDRKFPPVSLPGENGSAYDLRSPWDLAPDETVSLGLLAEGQFLPETQLGEVLHCPTFDNLANPAATGHNMDVQNPWGYGASFFVDVKNNRQPDPSLMRIIMGYDYRNGSWQYVKGSMGFGQAKSSFVMLTDILDVLVVGNKRQYGHYDGYSVGYGDASVQFRVDMDFKVQNYLFTQRSDGRLGGGAATAITDERVFEFIANVD